MGTAKGDAPGCDPHTAGFLARAQGFPRKAPDWLPGHTEAYQAQWLQGWDDKDQEEE